MIRTVICHTSLAEAHKQNCHTSLAQAHDLKLSRTATEFSSSNFNLSLTNASNLPSNPNLRPQISDYHPNDQNVVRRAYLLKGPNQPRQEVYPPTPNGKKFRRFKLKYYKQYVNWLEYSIDKDAIFCLHCYLWRDECGDHRDAFINDQERIDYRIRLTVSLDCIWFLLRQGLAFRGYDESKNSKNMGNFLELFKFLASHNEKVDSVSLKNALQNNLLISPDIQKDLVNSCVVETVNAIMKYLGEELFVVLIDEARDTSGNEQMAIYLRYVDKRGYNGASNMQGQFNGLKALILNENKSAIYVHCFAHQLQLALVHVAKDIKEIASFFTSVSNIVNVVGVSCKRRDNLQNKQAAKVFMQLKNGELSSGKGLNQEIGLKRPSDTRWGSHYGEAHVLLDLMHSFEFCFILHLMRNILGITNDLLKALQRKDQDIVNVLALVKVCKGRLQQMREGGWDSLFVDVPSFCGKHGIDVPRIEATFIHRGKSRRNAEETTYLHYYQVGFFYGCIDKQRVELDNRFDKVNTELLLCMACLNPTNSFSAFDVEKLIRLAEFYSDDFSEQEQKVLRNQLETYGIDMKSNNTFAALKGINVWLLQCFYCYTVERLFSVMNIVKIRLRNRMGDEWMNDCLVAYIENEVFDTIDNEAIMRRFQNMGKEHGRDRKGQL
ncbi:hypothetical protein AQUCO_02800092v1 [Aquilegia coerulea]|uniref:TTF-type domain-containing protein n=1 Tax=Aquilegia coerulea TaxID=218851 RepID=A0A2G5D3U3_AQUCA|nr:hypothetical protein AQUCO_02800092v1 [Aquilegia coerulea]